MSLPSKCYAKHEEYIMCLGILSSILVMETNPTKTIMYEYWETLMQHQIHRDIMKFVTFYMRIM